MELMEFKDLQKLAKAASRKTALTFSANGAEQTFTAADVDNVLREQFAMLTKDYFTFERNKITVFELVAETIDEVLPKKVMQQFERFADVKTIAQGDQAIFKIRITEAARKRAKSFVTRVGLAGRYETMILGGRELTVATSAIGYAIRLGFEEFLDGRYSFADFTEVMLEGMNEYIYTEIAKALAASIKQLPTANVFEGAGFDEVAMDELLAIADSYGNGAATIFCTREFAAKMLPQDKYVSEDMKNALWRDGMLGDYKGHTVIVLEQSMVDARNEEKMIDPSQAYIFANTGDKPVKLVFEGQTAIRQTSENDDWSTDLQTYMKFGVAVFTNPSICAYKNTDLKKASR